MQNIYARDTVATFIELNEAQSFVAAHHNQGSSAIGGDPRAIGLFLKEELLGVAIFCNPRTALKQREYTTELFRLAFHKDFRIVGGASKLIKFFKDKVNPADIFTYQTTAGENTDVYVHAGFSLKSKDKTKTILVKNGLTQENAKNNRSDWFSMYEVVNFGPDALLKQK